MNICLVAFEYPPETSRGGIGTQTWNKARALARLGHAVHVLTPAASAATDLQTTTQGGVTVHRMKPGYDFPLYEQQTYLLGHSWLVLRHLQRLVPTTAFDVIDFPEYGGEGFAYQMDRTLWNWVPVVVQLHGPLAMFVEYLGWPDQGSRFHQIGTYMEAFSVQQADALMACSRTVADLVSRYCGVARDAIDVVYCGVDAESFQPPPDNLRHNQRPTVLFVGHVVESKGVFTVVESVLRLRARYPNIRLQILGIGGDLDKIKARVLAAGAQGNVDFHGFVDRDRLPEFFQRADVFCAPSHFESFGIVFIEAMACGCPVIASTAGGTPEIVLDGQTGLLVPPNDIEATTQALDRLLAADAGLRRRMGNAGRRRVDDCFAMDKYIARVLAVYHKAIDRAALKRQQVQEAMGMADGGPA